ncbi:hypothetical protein BBO99_00004933 [Phytophthora kernoviae]|uniref:Letm1 RBD domain-containing protein n=2 Tax=Phytophthora kernoviae TaxID=325452 RepID=A0A421EVQ8_9STRA|nr:hypothetical protein G195_010504 [Phytophthora kernoviae 00238/432]KAG2508232.1 hypothetical protein JM16_008877 [Phytophthora kernoviae]KAG2510721.1 hypothetical protein JM18_008512 [Phytophthora kernoviae]RLN05738.1 hypothetical protein BBI17_008562 [Phytophthora kernoviae]RLN79911.1 hypothetical protein BBO99_00004933 [Phytophthora kernoviae]
MIRVEDVEKELPKVPERAVSLLKRTLQLTVQVVKALAHALQVLVTDPAALKKDDQDIIWEGLGSLDKEELQMACMKRGMRATGLTKAGYVPADNLEEALATLMSSMDEEVATENEMIADEEKFRDEAQKKETEAPKKAESEVAAAAAEPQTEVEQVIADMIMEKAQAQAETVPADAVVPGAATETKSDETPLPKTIENIISLEELSALESLAFKSLVEKERQTVSQLK